MTGARPEYDFVIAGSGLVGGVLACGLRDAGYRIAVIEPTERAVSNQPSHDDRTLVINAASLNILSNLDLLPDHLSRCPIRRIEVTQAGGLGHLSLQATDHGRDHFGAVMIARELGNTLLSAITQRLDTQEHENDLGCPILHEYCPAELETYTQESDQVRVRLTDGRLLTAAVLIGTDGTHSRVRQISGMVCHAHDYEQSALIFTAQPERHSADTAYERFTSHGPLAVLPVTGGRVGVVWIDHRHAIDELLAATDQDLSTQLTKRLGGRLGRFTALGRRSSYPLVMRHTPNPVSKRVVLLGNAANAVHPVSAQGFNLGLRDAAMFIEVMQTLKQTQPGADPAMQLAHYASLRVDDQAATVRYTDTLARSFAHPMAPIRWASGIGLAAHAATPALTRRLAQAAMGFRQPISRLAQETTKLS